MKNSKGNRQKKGWPQNRSQDPLVHHQQLAPLHYTSLARQKREGKQDKPSPAAIVSHKTEKQKGADRFRTQDQTLRQNPTYHYADATILNREGGSTLLSNPLWIYLCPTVAGTGEAQRRRSTSNWPTARRWKGEGPPRVPFLH